MTSKQPFLTILKKEIGRKKEFDRLEEISKNIKIELSFDLVRAFFLAVLGRKQSAEVKNEFSALLIGVTVSRLFRLEKIYEKSLSRLDELVEEDKNLRKFQRFIPQFDGDIKEVLDKSSSNSVLISSFLAILLLGKNKDEDLVVTSIRFGRTIDSLFVVQNLYSDIQLMKKSKFTSCSVQGLDLLREIVNKYAVLAMQPSISPLKENSKHTKEAKQIYKYVMRFDVLSEVRNMSFSVEEELLDILEEFEDIFLDFVQSSTRKSGFKQLKNIAKKQIKEVKDLQG